MTVRRTLGRSIRLFRAFLLEQSEPDVFYDALAQDSAAILGEHLDLRGKTVLDVGAGPANFERAFREVGARYVPLDRDRGVESVTRGGVVADAGELPFADGSVDVVFSSNLLEHVSEPEDVADELLRVVAPGGVLFLSYTNWLSPWGGHETSPWHWLGGQRAARRYQRRTGHPPKNLIDRTLFRVSVAQGMRWADKVSTVPTHGHAAAEVLAVRPRYWPDWAAWVLRFPGLREIVTWNLLIVVRKCP